MKEIVVDQSKVGKRTDILVGELWRIPSRSFLQNSWEELVLVNGKISKPSYRVRLGDKVNFFDEKVSNIQIANSYGEILPQKGDINIVLEEKDFLIINKPKGIPVHPGVKNKQNTLANFVVGYLKDKNEYDPHIERGGVVHRLDKSVSGLILFAKNLKAQKFFQKQFELHTVNKLYLAKLDPFKNVNSELGQFIPSEELDANTEIEKLINCNFELGDDWLKVEGFIGRNTMNRKKMIFKKLHWDNAKQALTYSKPLNREEVLIIIKTGRMYQIRATLEYLGTNIQGDSLFKTLKGGQIPNEIALESILLSCEDLSGNRFIARLR